LEHTVHPAAQVLGAVAVFAAAFLINLPTLRYGFLTSWDDPTYVVDNPWIRGFTRENLLFVFTHPYFANFLPLHMVSYMVDYSFWKLNPFGYHLQSVLLNAVNAVLALWVVRRLLGGFLPALIAALLFAVHPSHVEAVAWISIRKDILSTTFLLLTVHFYLRAIGGRALKPGPYTMSIVCFTLGLLSKMSIVALPLFLLLIDAIPMAQRKATPWKTALVNKIPYGVIGLVLVRLNSLAQVKAQAAYAHDPILYLMVKGHAVWKYLALLTGVPASRPVYDTPQLALTAWPVVSNLAGLLILPLLVWIAWRRGWREWALGAGWVFVLILPAILFPLVTYMADRYLYAPSLGACWCLALGIVWLGARAGAGPLRAGLTAVLTALVFAGFAYRTIEYNRVWSSGEALWSYAITKSRDYRPRNNMAQVRLNQKRYAEAERLYRQAAEIENFVSYQGLATVCYDTHRYAEAEKAIDRALELARRARTDYFDISEIQYTRGAILWVQGRNQEAIGAWEEAVRVNPRHERAREWLNTARGQAATR
jgi:hypothetical protein